MSEENRKAVGIQQQQTVRKKKTIQFVLTHSSANSKGLKHLPQLKFFYCLLMLSHPSFCLSSPLCRLFSRSLPSTFCLSPLVVFFISIIRSLSDLMLFFLYFLSAWMCPLFCLLSSELLVLLPVLNQQVCIRFVIFPLKLNQ